LTARGLTNLLLVLLVGASWGLLTPASKVLYGAEPAIFDGFTITVARGGWALPFFLAGLAVTWRLDPPRLDLRRWVAVLAAGIVFAAGVSLFFTLAAQHTSIAHVSFVLGVTPVTNTALAALVFRTRLDRRGILALALGVVGVVLLAISQSNDRAGLLGDGFLVAWLAAFGAYSCLLRYVGTRVGPATLMSLVGSIAMATMLLIGLAAQGTRALGHVADTPTIAWWFFGEVVLGSTLLGQTAFAAVVRRLGVAVGTIGVEYTALAVGVAASVAAHERWTPLTVLAGLLLCSALAATFVRLPLRGRAGLA
jgi:drug/metabolite transporter (DMT)-like permease